MFFLNCQFVIAQQFNFRNFSVKEGIAQSQVYSVLQDSRGYLWMGTRGGGITRYDGFKFVSYTKKDLLSSNYIYVIKESKDGKLLIGTNNGFSTYNGLKFESYGVRTGDTSQFSVLDIAVGTNNDIWLATNQGVYKFADKKLTNISNSIGENPIMVNTILIDKKGRIMYGTVNGLNILEYNGKTYKVQRLYKQAHFRTGSINTLKSDKNGNIWIGTYKNGLYQLGKDSAVQIRQNVLSTQSIFDIYFDDEDNVWLATLNNGVCIYNLVSKSVKWISEIEGLSNNHVRSICRDRNGNYWFGTSGGGICNYFGNQFTTYDKSSGLPGNFIYSLFKDSRNRLFIGNSDKGFTILDSGKFIIFNSKNRFGDYKIKAICEDDFGRIFLGTEANGAFIFSQDTFISILGLEKKYIKSIVKDIEGNMVIGTSGTGIFIFTKESQYQNFVQLQMSDGLMGNRISCLHVDKTGKIWYGTENNGISWISHKMPSKVGFTISDGLPSNSIRCLTEDNKGNLWIGSAGSGISKMSIYKGQTNIINYDYKDGLSSSNIYLLTFDDKQRLFAGSETGLDLLEFDQNYKIAQVKHFSKGEGFTGIETCQNAVAKESNGTLWFGTINGLIRYISSQNFKNLSAPVLRITNVKLFYEPLLSTPFKSFIGEWNLVKNIELPHNKNHLTFDFMGINFNNPEAVVYKWKLEGFDEGWSPPSKQNTVTYSNLPFGDFTFKVLSCNEEGVWNTEPQMIHITIKVPFWRQTWVIVCSIIAILTLITLLFRLRINTVKRKAAEREEKLRLEKELIELEQKALRLQMNPHFIFNALNSIQSQIGTNQDQSARYYLAKFSRLMRQILDNSRSTMITLEEEINTLENYLLIEKFCNGDRFDYTINVNEQLDKDFIQMPPMLLQPFIENAIKHGMKNLNSRRGHITIIISEENNCLLCAVEDNGVGREASAVSKEHSKETYHKSTALKVTEERLEIYKEHIKEQPLKIIDLRDKDGNAMGTRIEIRIPI